MAIDFPTSPTPGQQVTSGSRTWTWSGTYWANNTITGVQGTQGLQGYQGTQGTQGIQGLLGTQGSQGLQGIQGIQGITGAQGITGIQGTQGTQGLQGIMGAQGAQGTQGTQGAQGIQGTQGTQGIQGITGAQGISGASILGTNNTWTGTNAFGTLSASGSVTVSSSTTLAAGEPSIVLQGVSNTERLHIRSALGAAAAGQPVMLLAAARGTIASPTAVQDGDDLGYYQLGGYNGTTYRRGAWIAGKAEGAHSATSSGTAILFQTTENGSVAMTERMRITGSGNVGIGVTPSAWDTDRKPIQLGSGTFINGSASVASFAEVGANFYVASGPVQKYLTSAAASNYRQIFGAHQWWTAPSGTAGATISTFTVAMTLDASGNLGIGTTSPSYKLDVAGNIKTSGLLLEKFVSFTPTTTGWYRIINVGSSGGGLVRISANYDNAVTDVEFQFNIGGYGTDGSIQQTRYASYNGGVIDKARISSDGSGSCYLDIYVFTATSPAAISLYFYGPQMPSPVASPVVGATVGSTNVRTLTLGHGFRTTNGSNFAEVSGNVGIGTTSPGTKLQVQATGIAYNTAGLFITTAGGTDGIAIGDSGSGAYKSIQSYGGALVLNSLGNNVGIGTTSPAQKLHVNSSSATVTPITTTSVTGDTLYQAILVTKFDNDSTTSQNFIQFQINNGGANCGKITANGANTAAFGSTSDRRVKENIADLPSQLASIMALRPVEFDYVESYGGGHQIGFVAQEMQQVYPDVIAEDSSEEKILSITGWSKTEARLVKALQELNANLVAELQSLRQRVAALESK